MGWTGTYYDGESIEEFFDNEFVGDKRACKGSVRGNTYYSAWYDKEGNIYASVILFHIKGNEITYKEITENGGPYECDCPQRILKILSPTTNEYALDWRNRCIEKRNKLKKIKLNTIIRFKTPIEFYILDKATDFKWVGRNKFIHISANVLVKIKGWKDREFEIVG